MAPFLTRKQTDLGTVLVKMGACTEEHVARARAAQDATDTPKRIGEVLVDSGEVSAEEVARALDLQKKLRNGGAIKAAVEICEKLTTEILQKAG